eukprot:gene10300-2717_t
MFSTKTFSKKYLRYYSQPKCGFIGLGNMGANMAPHLLEKGAVSELHVFDLNQDSVAMLKSKGASVCSNVQEICSKSDVIITMLPSSASVVSVYESMKEVMKGNQLFIDASTIDPQTAQNVNKLVGEQQSDMIDAPVSGGVGGAAAGTLTFMCGGTEKAVNDAKEKVLQFMGKNIVHCGKSGMGQVAKISNNLLLATTMAAVSESMILGTNLGMDPKILAGIINSSTGRCWSSDTYNPYPGVMEGVPSSRGYTGGFGSKLMLKDIGLALEAILQNIYLQT